ncbi:Histone-lysine N-methyltransferase SUVR4 [Linum grandiflorum]
MSAKYNLHLGNQNSAPRSGTSKSQPRNPAPPGNSSPVFIDLVDDDEENEEQSSRPSISSARLNTIGEDSVQLSSNSQSSSQAASSIKYPMFKKDISRGLENFKIPLINRMNLKPPSILYIRTNMVYKDAHVDFSLARISDEDCCGSCAGDCLASELPCGCAAETGGEFAYTREGLLKGEFIDRCVAMNKHPEKKHYFYCEKNCPLGKDLSRKGKKVVQACKGHLSRKFIKECWLKCGCSKKCGNRVVQNGIRAPLQVFASSTEKGWGVRSATALKKGTFICEYNGEIVTNQELFERNKKRAEKNEIHTYPVLLDADWGSERILKDEEALCLDATEIGNVGRFINHRCGDANLIEMPVEVESPDHHYYHVAFFTMRDVEAMEELTWDYGIEFDDIYHPIKAFKCKCGSKWCRDKNRR